MATNDWNSESDPPEHGGLDTETREYILGELRKLRAEAKAQRAVIRGLVAEARQIRKAVAVIVSVTPGESGDPAHHDREAARAAGR